MAAPETGVPDLAVLADLLAGMTPLPRYELRCGPGVIWWLRLWLAAPEADAEARPPWPESIGRLTGLPMIDDPELARGEWKILRNGDVTASGRMEIPEFVDKPIEIRFSLYDLPRVADRLDWRMSAMISRPPSFPGLIGSAC